MVSMVKGITPDPVFTGRIFEPIDEEIGISVVEDPVNPKTL